MSPVTHRRRVALALGALLAALAAPAWAAPGAPTPLAGTVFVAGGHIADDDNDLWEGFARAAAPAPWGQRPRVAVFCSARDSLATARAAFERDAPGAWSYQHVLRAHGLDPVFVPIAIDNYARAARDAANVALVAGASAVWFGGGGQNLHARCLLEDDGRDTPLMTAVRGVFARGGVVGGTSAGAAIMDRTTYGDGESADYLRQNALVFRPLASVTGANARFGGPHQGAATRGFNLLAAIDAAVDTHVDARGRYGRVLVAMRALHNSYGLALAENTALAVHGARGEVFGAGRVLIADGRHALYGPAGRPFSAQGLRLSVLAAHDRFDFPTGTIVPERGAAPIAPGQGPAPACPDVLAGDNLPRLLEGFASRAIAQGDYPAAASDRPRSGFTFSLGRGPATRAYRAPADGHLAVQSVELAVTPTRPGPSPRPRLEHP